MLPTWSLTAGIMGAEKLANYFGSKNQYKKTKTLLEQQNKTIQNNTIAQINALRNNMFKNWNMLNSRQKSQYLENINRSVLGLLSQKNQLQANVNQALMKNEYQQPSGTATIFQLLNAVGSGYFMDQQLKNNRSMIEKIISQLDRNNNSSSNTIVNVETPIPNNIANQSILDLLNKKKSVLHYNG